MLLVVAPFAHAAIVGSQKLQSSGRDSTCDAAGRRCLTEVLNRCWHSRSSKRRYHVHGAGQAVNTVIERIGLRTTPEPWGPVLYWLP